MPHITFAEIPGGILVPGVYNEFDTTSGVKSIPNTNPSIVVVAQKTTADTVFPENTVVQVFKEADVETQAGSGSIAHITARAIFRAKANSTLFMVYQNDAGGGSDAVGTITIAGTPTAAGFIDIWIGAEKLEIAVATTDTFGTIAIAIDTAVNGRAILPVTSGVVGGVVTLTTKNAGTLGNAIPVSHLIREVTGITVVDVQPTGGGVDPTFQDALDAIFPTDIRHVFSTYNDSTNLGLLKTHLNDSSTAPAKKYRLGWTGVGYLTISSVNSLANSLNEERLEITYLRYSKTTAQGHSLDYVIGAANIGVYAAGQNPALPRNALEVPGVVSPALEEQLSFNEQQSLLTNGVAPLAVLPGQGVSIVRTVSTKTDTLGVEDFTLLDIQITDTLDTFAFALIVMYRRKFAQRGITNALLRIIRSEILDIAFIFEDLQRLRDVEENQDRLIVEEGLPGTNSVNVDVPAEVVPGLHVINQKITLIVD